jgi:tetratricopeptide (TPR) repeat protein
MTTKGIGLAGAIVLLLSQTVLAAGDGLDRVRGGNAALDAGRLAEAAAAYRDATRDPGAAPLAWLNLGVTLARQQQPAEAARAFARAARLASSDGQAARAHYNRGVVLERSGELRESLAAFMDALRKDPAREDARINLAIVRARLERDQPLAPPPPAPEDDLEEALQQVPAPSYAFTKGVKRTRPAVAMSDW